MSKHTAAEVNRLITHLDPTRTETMMLHAYADLLTEVNEALAVIGGPSSIKDALSIFHDEHCQLHDLLSAQEKAEPVAEFKADENGHITLRALDAWQGETGNLYTHPPVPPEGAGHD